MDKRKVTYEQDKALASGRDVARANQRRRVAAHQADERADAERARALAEHRHGWKNWQYADDYKTETRTCRHPGCDVTETRAVRL